MKDLGAALERLRRERLYRHRRIADGPQGPETVVDGRPVLAFCSNDYLGLAAHPAVVAALCEGAQGYGAGAGAAHLVNGHSRPHHELEEALADLTGRPRALLFSTGYMANLGVALALTGHGDLILQDRLNHASLIDAGRLAEARLRRYGHGRVDELATRLGERRNGDCLVMTDAVFSMDGDLAPLPAMAELCRAHGAWLMVDDAHGIGVLGERGAGTLEHYGLGLDEVPVLMGTLGKALGTFGAFVAGGEDLVEYLVQRARTYVYTTAMPPGVAAATLAALRVLREEPERRARLHANLARFRAGAAERGLPLTDSTTPIQPVVLGRAEAALAASRALLERGILVTAIRPPTVAEGTARLRITLSAAHRPEHVERLLDALLQALPQDTPGP